MKNILILANGEMAKHFVRWVGKSRIDDNHYYITCSEHHTDTLSASMGNINFINIDPTSLMRLKNIMEDQEFSTVFIVMNEKDESLYALKNIRTINPKIFVVFVSKWDDLLLDDENLTLLNVNELLSVNLYEKLPNVPMIAKNIGLGKGEIMEILIPFGSSFAYRHIGSISHRKWRVVAIYRKEKQIFPNSATMLLPNDRLVVIGNPIVLEEVYKRINRRQGVFPEPFGKNLYLIIEMQQSHEEIQIEIDEAIFLKNQLPNTKLYIRLIHIRSLTDLHQYRSLENDTISVLINYNDSEIFTDIDYDVSQLDIGVFLLSNGLFFQRNYKKHLYGLMRPIYVFGDNLLYNIKEAVVLMGEGAELESLSTSVFDFSESLGLKLNLCDYNPEGDFEESDKIIEHYESLSKIYNFKINIEKKKVNPIRELLKHDEILHIAPFNKSMKNLSFINFFSTQLSHYFISIKKHPQLLIPVDN